tara:strand:- start:2633 stop:2743 length:111 start_codon:yes stop_codon:yes gene_type:complete
MGLAGKGPQLAKMPVIVEVVFSVEDWVQRYPTVADQ